MAHVLTTYWPLMRGWSPFLIDTLLEIISCAIAVAAMLFAYHVGTPTWPDRFAVKIRQADGTFRRKPGQLGETAMVVLLTIILIFVDRMTPDVFTTKLVLDHSLWSAGIFLFVVILVIVYELYICHKAAHQFQDQSYIRALTRGYVLYTFYSIINFSMIVMIACMIIFQFKSDTLRLANKQQDLGSLYQILDSVYRGGPIDPEPSSLERIVEGIYGHIVIDVSAVVGEINTVLLILIVTLFMSFLLNFTPLHSVYEPSAIRTSNRVTFVAALVVLIAGGLIYFYNYFSLVNNALEHISKLHSIMIIGPWQVTRRYYAIIFDLTNRRGIMGFLVELTTERGGLILLLGILQFVFTTRRELRDARAHRDGF